MQVGAAYVAEYCPATHAWQVPLATNCPAGQAASQLADAVAPVVNVDKPFGHSAQYAAPVTAEYFPVAQLGHADVSSPEMAE